MAAKFEDIRADIKKSEMSLERQRNEGHALRDKLIFTLPRIRPYPASADWPLNPERWKLHFQIITEVEGWAKEPLIEVDSGEMTLATFDKVHAWVHEMLDDADNA